MNAFTQSGQSDRALARTRHTYHADLHRCPTSSCPTTLSQPHDPDARPTCVRGLSPSKRYEPLDATRALRVKHAWDECSHLCTDLWMAVDDTPWRCGPTTPRRWTPGDGPRRVHRHPRRGTRRPHPSPHADTPVHLRGRAFSTSPTGPMTTTTPLPGSDPHTDVGLWLREEPAAPRLRRARVDHDSRTTQPVVYRASDLSRSVRDSPASARRRACPDRRTRADRAGRREGDA